MPVSMDGISYRLGARLPARADRSAQYMLVRLLVGGGHISKVGRRHSHHQRRDLYSWPSVEQTSTSATATSDFLKEQVGRGVSSFISATVVDNRKLFGDVLSEISNYFCATAAGAHPSAFVFLYRTLERLSFSVPLLYCATATDFHGTFNELKRLFNDGADGDLSLLRKFVNDGRFLDRTVVDTVVRIDFSCSPHADKFYEIITSRFSDTEASDPTRKQIDVRFGKMQGLLETVRNRFFHFRTGDARKNISSKDLVDVDEFFQLLNPHIENFLSKLLLQAIIVKYRR